jgi:aryl carrier-like protein
MVTTAGASFLLTDPNPGQPDAIVRAADADGGVSIVYYVVGRDIAGRSLLGGFNRSDLEFAATSSHVQREGEWGDPAQELGRDDLGASSDDALGPVSLEPPQGELERSIASIWSELLGVERIGRHVNFFELGGHSLVAVQMVARVRRLNAKAHLRILFANPTIASMAAALNRGGASDEDDSF